MSDSQGRSDTYWAADPDETYVVESLAARHGDWCVWQSNPIVQAWVRNLMAYYSTVFRASNIDTSLIFSGRQGELVEMMVPEARSLVGDLVSLLTKRRLAYQTLVRPNAKSDALRDARFGNSLIDQILDHERVDVKQKTLCEGSLVAGQWFIGALWRPDLGAFWDRDEFGRAVMKGKAEIITPTVFDVLYNHLIPEWEKVPWVDIRVPRLRWDLVAQYPHLRDEILGLEPIGSGSGPWMWSTEMDGDDMVWAYYFIHRPTAALPNGRIIYYSSPETIYDDAKNAYETIPLERMAPSPILGTGFGYPFFSDLLPAQEMLDHTFSAIATNHGGLAVKNIAAPKGSGVTRQDIGGMNLFTFNPMPNMPDGGMPKTLDLLGSNAECYKFAEILSERMERISKINGALRGTPPAGVTSGRAIATLVQNALEFINDTGKALELTMEQVVMHAVNCYKNFAKVDQDLVMYGRNNQAKMSTFNKEDLQNFAAVKVSAINPLMQTQSGRSDLAKELKAEGFITTGGEYMQILEGAPPEKVMRRQMSAQDLIDMENQMLMDGEEPPVLSTDDHGAHYQQHMELLNDPYVRQSSRSVAAVMAHADKHVQQSQSVDPYIYAMARTGQVPQMNSAPPEETGAQQAGGAPESAQPEQEPAEPAEDMLQREGNQ